jgi:hypothetical protein
VAGVMAVDTAYETAAKKPARPMLPLEPPILGFLETDLFCRRCGYNLHGQRVWRDGPLGILVCRCPECGTHESAGRSGIEQLWMSRGTMILVLLWSAMLIGGFATAWQTLADAQWDYVINYLYGTGSWDRWGWVHSPTKFDVQYVLPICAAATIGWCASLCIGLGAAVFLSHLNRWLHYILLLAPIYSGAVHAWQTCTICWGTAADWITRPLWTQVIIQLALMLFGIQFGRPLARFLLRTLLNRRLLQAVGYLWHIDGLNTPGILMHLPVIQPPRG